MFVFGKSADLKFRGNALRGQEGEDRQCPVLKELIICLRGQGRGPAIGQGCPCSAANEWHRQYKEKGVRAQCM